LQQTAPAAPVPPTALPPGPEDHIPTAVLQAIARVEDPSLPTAERAASCADVLKYAMLDDTRLLLDGLGAEAVAANPEAAALSGFCDRLLAGEALLARLFPGAPPSGRRRHGILVAPAPGATRTVLVFSGIAAVPFPLNFAFFHQKRDCHFVFLSDPTRRFLLVRTPRLGNSYGETLGTVRSVLEALGTRRQHAMGLSSGGYPALRLGLDLGAEGVLNFSGPTTIDMEDDPGAPMSKYPQLVAIYRSAPQMVIGTHKLYAAAAERRPQAILIYGDAHERDTRMAHMLADHLGGAAGGIHLRPMPGFAEHDTFTAYVERGWVEDAFAELLALDAQPVGGG
jgi:hypothetical protein